MWTSTTIDTFASGKEFNILHREYDYYYIQYYDSNNVLKRGYVPRSCTAITVSRWCNHNIFDPGISMSSTTQNVYYRPNAASAVSGSIDADEGVAANKPLIVLSRLGNYYFVQYVANKSNDGSQHVQWRRGWVPIDGIYVSIPQSTNPVPGKDTFYIQNVGTGKYLSLSDINASNKSDIEMFDFEGDEPQKWTFEFSNSSASNADYVTIKTNVSNSSSTGRILSIRDALSVTNTQIELRNAGSPPSKDQEFFIKDSGYTSADGETEYVICSRLTGNYMQLGVYDNQMQEGAPAIDRYPNVTPYNRWRIIPVGGTKNVRYVWLKYDNTCITANISATNLETAFRNATSAIYSTFGIKYRILATTYTAELDGSTCTTSSLYDTCNSSCGPISQCDSMHTKNSSRLLGGSKPNDFYTLYMVGHKMCGYSNPNHIEKLGTAWTNGYSAIASYLSPDFESTIQHEMSHNIGATHGLCDQNSTALCVLKSQYGNYHAKNTWCGNCNQSMTNHKANYN